MFSISAYVVGNLQSCLQIGNYAARNDALLLVIVPALQAPDVASSRALRIARELDSEGVYDILHKTWTLFITLFTYYSCYFLVMLDESIY